MKLLTAKERAKYYIDKYWNLFVYGKKVHEDELIDFVCDQIDEILEFMPTRGCNGIIDHLKDTKEAAKNYFNLDQALKTQSPDK